MSFSSRAFQKKTQPLYCLLLLLSLESDAEVLEAAARERTESGEDSMCMPLVAMHRCACLARGREAVLACNLGLESCAWATARCVAWLAFRFRDSTPLLSPAWHHAMPWRWASGQMGVVEDRVREKLTARFKPSHLEILNESYKHNVPKGSESHFKVVIVSSEFDAMPLIKVR